MTDDAPIRVAGLWAYEWAHRRKPHLHPVATPSGHVLTQVEPADHPWQRGVWFVVRFVDGDNFWEEGDPDGWGVQRHTGRPAVSGTGADGTTIEGDLDWARPDRRTVAVTEHRRLTHVELGGGAYVVDLDVTLWASGGAILDRSPYNGLWGGYSGLAFRGRSDWADTRLLLDDGSEHDRVAPQRSRWCDLASAAGGVCVLDHPANPSHPVPFYAACRAGPGYGEGWSNTLYPAFLWEAPCGWTLVTSCGSAPAWPSTTARGTPPPPRPPGRRSPGNPMPTVRAEHGAAPGLPTKTSSPVVDEMRR